MATSEREAVTRPSYADGVLAGRAGVTDTRLPGIKDDEEDDRADQD